MPREYSSTISPPCSEWAISDAITKRRGGILVHVRLTPKSAKEGLAGLERRPDGKAHLRVNVRAVPEKGRANKALEALIARALGVAKRDVRVASGLKSRYKSVLVSGDPAGLLDRATSLLDSRDNKVSEQK